MVVVLYASFAMASKATGEQTWIYVWSMFFHGSPFFITLTYTFFLNHIE